MYGSGRVRPPGLLGRLASRRLGSYPAADLATLSLRERRLMRDMSSV